MIWADDRGRVIDYLGTHQHLAVDLDLAVDPAGGPLLTTDVQRFYEGRLIAFRFSTIFSGVAELHESYDDKAELYRTPERLKPVRHELRT